MSSSPKAAQAEALPRAPTPTSQVADCILPQLWGPHGVLLRSWRRDLSWGERSLGWGGGGSVTARVTSWCQMPSGGSDQPVRHCGREGDRGGL